MEESKALVNLMTTQEVISPLLSGDGALPFFTDVTVTYDDPAMDEVQAAVNDSTVMATTLPNDSPQSAVTNLLDTLTKVVSGIKFNADDLKAAQSSFDKDKGTVTAPAE